MHDIEQDGCYAAEESHVRLTSLPSSGSLPYDERQAYHSAGKTTFRPRRRTKPARSRNTHHHRPSRTTCTYTNEPPPSLMAIGSAMVNILSLYIMHNTLLLKRSCRQHKRRIGITVGAIVLFLLAWISVLILGFHMDATRVCSPPRDLFYMDDRPLVEYYIHGRGNGHYARSMAIIETLNKKGIDVRMFIGRAPIWNFFHQTKPLLGGEKGTTTAIAVTSIQPNIGIFNTLSQVMERIMGDCEVALQTERYPILVISDGDAPGMLRAYYGDIPSLAISHGQIFNIAVKPDWVLSDQRLNEAWDKQGFLNKMSSMFSSWQIGTDFGYLETKHASAIVARPPLRPEVEQMAASRKSKGLAEVEEIRQRMAHLVLYGTDEVDANVTLSITTSVTHRKLVLCYFRDHNGELIIDALLQAGFDVLFFETGYNKKFGKDPNRFGQKWIVREQDRLKLREAAQFGSSTAGDVESSSQQRRRLSKEEEETTSKDDTPPPPRRRRRLASDSSSSPRLIRVADRALFVPFMAIADGIVASAGSQLISECIYAHIPLLALYRMDDDEQVLNVELSRQERVVRRKIAVFGASFENFHAAYPTKYSYIRSSNNRTIHNDAVHHYSSGAKVARSEFESFVDAVDESVVSQAYFEHLGKPVNDTQYNITATSIENGDPFHGMPDAAAIILEVIKEIQKEAEER